MPAELDRLLALDRALQNVRFAERMLVDREVFASWRGPASQAFAEAFDALPELLRSAAVALDRDRDRTMLALRA